MNVYLPSHNLPNILAQVISHESWTIGDLCVVKPSGDKIKKDKYWIGQIVRFEMLDDDAAVGVQWWVSRSSHNKDDQLAGVFVLEGQNVDVIWVSSLVDKITFTSQFHLTITAKKKIAYHVQSWIDESGILPNITQLMRLVYIFCVRTVEDEVQGCVRFNVCWSCFLYRYMVQVELTRSNHLSCRRVNTNTSVVLVVQSIEFEHRCEYRGKIIWSKS